MVALANHVFGKVLCYGVVISWLGNSSLVTGFPNLTLTSLLVNNPSSWFPQQPGKLAWPQL